MVPRIGFGYDVHRLEEGIPFRLGGVDIDHSKGAMGHSDADVLIHAICDALFGAAALGDIGSHFPDTDEKYRGINSLELLAETVSIVRKAGYAIGNVDSTVCLEKPKIRPYIDTMRELLAKTMEVETSALSVKATTEEKMGFTGSEDGVSAYAVVLLYPKES